MAESHSDPSPAGAGTVLITRKASFCASHRYAHPDWSDEKNREVFGPCFNPHGHGHNYELEVTVAGEVSPETGMVLNLKTVDRIIREEVLERLDHRHINAEVEGFDRKIPTCENLVLKIWEWLAPRFREESSRLERLRLHESDSLHAEITAGD